MSVCYLLGVSIEGEVVVRGLFFYGYGVFIVCLGVIVGVCVTIVRKGRRSEEFRFRGFDCEEGFFDIEIFLEKC